MKNTRNNELAVCGFAAVKKIEKNHPEKIRRLYFTKDVAPLFGGLCKKLASQRGIYNQVENGDLEKLCGTVHHQGVVAMIFMPEITPLDSAITETWSVDGENVLVLDCIGNANNFGAIIRSAAFFGIKNIVIPNDESQTTLTTSAYRIAEGGMEYVKIFSVNSIEKLLKASEKKFLRIGTDLRARKTVSEVSEKLKNSKKKNLPFMLVLGNEERGISKKARENCDELVVVPFGGMCAGEKNPKVESLNVAQAASVLLYELCVR